MCLNNRVHYGWWSYWLVCTLHFSLSSLCNLWIYILCVMYVISSMGLRSNRFSHLSFIQCFGLCNSILYISLVMIVRIFALYPTIITKTKIWINSHCLGLGQEEYVCVVFLAIFLITNHYCGRRYICWFSRGRPDVSTANYTTSIHHDALYEQPGDLGIICRMLEINGQAWEIVMYPANHQKNRLWPYSVDFPYLSAIWWLNLPNLAFEKF